MKLEKGKSYKIRIPNTQHRLTRIHIDAVLKNPVYTQEESQIYGILDIIVYRLWNKYKKSWIWQVELYIVLCIWNDWPVKKNV